MSARLASLIENYRSIKKIDFNPASLCALVGENNVGKSNILRAVNIILGESWPSERAFGPEDFHNHDTSRPILIEVWRDKPYTLNPPRRRSLLSWPTHHGRALQEGCEVEGQGGGRLEVRLRPH